MHQLLCRLSVPAILSALPAPTTCMKACRRPGGPAAAAGAAAAAAETAPGAAAAATDVGAKP